MHHPLVSALVINIDFVILHFTSCILVFKNSTPQKAFFYLLQWLCKKKYLFISIEFSSIHLPSGLSSASQPCQKADMEQKIPHLH